MTAAARPVTPLAASGAPKPPKRKPLALIVGVAAAALASASVTKWEGTRFVGYLDLVGIPTKCTGDTRDVVVGRAYSKAECAESDERQIVDHAEPVLRCTPGLKEHPHQLAAAISLTYNIGPKAYCGSTIARRFNAGQWKAACDGFLAWNRAGGRVVQGLANRRADERQLCLKGISA